MFLQRERRTDRARCKARRTRGTTHVLRDGLREFVDGMMELSHSHPFVQPRPIRLYQEAFTKMYSVDPRQLSRGVRHEVKKYCCFSVWK